MKRCAMCGELKPESEFNKHSASKDGLYYQCRECHAAYQREWRKRNREKCRLYNQRYYMANIEHLRADAREYYRRHTNECKERSKKWAKENQDKLRECKRKYDAANRLRRKVRNLARYRESLNGSEAV